MWMAWFNWRSPRGFNRWRFFGPEDASIGAVPLWRAKCPALGNLPMSPTRPMMIAAVNEPIPWTSVTVVPVAMITTAVRLRTTTRAASSTLISASSWCPAAIRSSVTGPSMFTLTSSSAALVTVKARPADRAGPVGGDLVIPIGQQAQHHPMLVEAGDDVQRRVVPSSDRCRTGIVGVGLVDPTALEQPHSRQQLRWHVDHVLAGGNDCWANNAPIPVAPSMAQIRGENRAAHANRRVR